MSEQPIAKSPRRPRNKRYQRQGRILAIPTHPFIQFTTRYFAGNSVLHGYLRVMLNFTTDTWPSHDIFTSLFEILPEYAPYSTNVYIGMVFKEECGNGPTGNDARRSVLAKVVEQMNEHFDFVKLHFVLHLRYFSFDHIIPACAIYGLHFQQWTFDILTDDVSHIAHDSVVDRYLRGKYYMSTRNTLSV
ncbi:hypothetical protein DSL72_007887 [Monilinia vaccinii-corymbosi]|uniref:Uncharacterized protein n=1 Tax=Monilinia vaccinii-corymbosi TaxID=61207 RepID=A0A8A3PJ22_9HELO|nr:hypothetical protein DSL72_007887 [Monilinia vaccinii-corymbosi]